MYEESAISLEEKDSVSAGLSVNPQYGGSQLKVELSKDQKKESFSSTSQKLRKKQEFGLGRHSKDHPTTGTNDALFPENPVPICHVIESVSKVMAHWCFQYRETTSFCFSNLLKFPDHQNNYETMQMHLAHIQATPECGGKSGVALLGFKMDSTRISDLLRGQFHKYFTHHSKFDAADCFRLCAFHGEAKCAQATFDSRGCTLCEPVDIPRRARILFVLSNATGHSQEDFEIDCIERAKNRSVNMKHTVEIQGNSYICHGYFTAYLDMSHCVKVLATCESGEMCQTHSFLIPQRNPMPNLRGSFLNSRLGIPVFMNSVTYNMDIITTDFAVQVNVTEALVLCKYFTQDNDHIHVPNVERNGENLVNLLSLTTALKNRNACRKHDCDTIEVKINVAHFVQEVCPSIFAPFSRKGESQVNFDRDLANLTELYSMWHVVPERNQKLMELWEKAVEIEANHLSSDGTYHWKLTDVSSSNKKEDEKSETDKERALRIARKLGYRQFMRRGKYSDSRDELQRKYERFQHQISRTFEMLLNEHPELKAKMQPALGEDDRTDVDKFYYDGYVNSTQQTFDTQRAWVPWTPAVVRLIVNLRKRSDLLMKVSNDIHPSSVLKKNQRNGNLFHLSSLPKW